ncbi:MAG: sulfite reductase [Chitinophagaceae bacterium]|nr:MAG: sulfite reductase [Chitinophagaceae bacterium]
MLNEEKKKLLEELLTNLTREEISWVNGYFSGLLQPASGVHPPAPEDVAPAAGFTQAPAKLVLAYGTETGNAKKLAGKLVAAAKKKGLNFRLAGLDNYRFADLSKEDHFFVIISTQGEGEPPIPAKAFYDQLMEKTLTLPNIKYSVLALGDTSYPLYCKTGEDVDAAFEKHGATRVLGIQRCDVDYEEDAAAWFEKVMEIAGRAGTVTQPSKTAVLAAGAGAVTGVQTGITSPVGSIPAANGATPAAKKPAGKKYYDGRISSNIVLNDHGSEKQTYHIEISTEEEVTYECGDTIGIVPRNRPDVVARIIALSGLPGTEELQASRLAAPLEELLTRHVNVCYLMGNTVKKYAAITGHTIPDVRMDLVDLLRIYPVADTGQFREVIKILLPIAPRLYTVASSPSAHGKEEVHITVARDRFMAEDEQRFGLCSEFLGDQPAGTPLTFYVHREKNFKMPASGGTPMIMIGPGTGIAPFRSFLAERDATGADGRNWLFFGERHFLTDFLYQSEIQAFVETGVLEKINLAFSRDQEHKVYVQHRMLANAAELYEWMEAGAHVYVSGTKDPMSKDVEACLLKIIGQEGQLSEEEAKAYLDRMDKENRYQTDVY